MAREEHTPYDEEMGDGDVDHASVVEEEFEYLDPSELKNGAPGWVVALVAVLALAVGAGAMLLSGITREDLLGSDIEDAEPVATTICSGNANVRSTGSLNGDVVDTLSFGDPVAGMLTGGWVKLGEGRYVSVSVLCDLTPAGTDPVAVTDSPDEEVDAGQGDGDQATAEPETPVEDEQPETTDDGRLPGTFEASGSGAQTLELPEDVRSGVITFQHNGDGTFSLAGTHQGDTTSTPALVVDGDFGGTLVFGVGSPTSALLVDGTSWNVLIAPLETAPEMVDGVGSLSTAAFYLGEEPGRWRFNPSAPATLVQYSPDGSTASAELTGLSEVELLGGGTYLVLFTAGEWTAEPVTDISDAPDTDVDVEESTQAP